MAFMPQSVIEVQQTVEALVSEVQISHLLPKQKAAFLCCAQCCDTAKEVKQLEGCIQRCSIGSTNAQKAIQQQLGEFQERFQRAAIRCQDNVKDSFSMYDSSPSDQAKAHSQFNDCMEATGKEFLQKIPKLRQDMQAALKHA
uniref:Protein FAM136A n=1 Tax=Polytomella parva TaxID=51329 RepID=A0A7S0UU73_9CHLO|mmetsp:Transcript_2225/g.3358  ORF Transcript_2225/g.3358 Transcript_2225/m.3358 type:complete len:142 (+) Transcript_2225:87-512(+)|eukprot:CAMPEP_0175063142 /NCGR_PEP_ID=MMETSP0052_2-20121109/14579_1 /TAXON_ID=51329 ORGANISM="Polytomella parva, Strain SAG 63-3" /NCGR_SAMPLE_ID=MMETSP0052_2 /ASSEMBLY_ACC=CAM_ASM_000194 /LENGTH=141 /DNA_ID=CAMNT_0016329281 /DNA_START=197 /DNA_END=622 /DNA_ORIENTATION=-